MYQFIVLNVFEKKLSDQMFKYLKCLIISMKICKNVINWFFKQNWYYFFIKMSIYAANLEKTIFFIEKTKVQHKNMQCCM